METIPWMIALSWILLEADPWADSSLPAPRLSSSLPYSVVVKGEEIPLNCSLPKGVELGSLKGSHRGRFHFYCRDQSRLLIDDQHSPNNTFNAKTEHLSSGQIRITCACKIKESSWEGSSSPESNQLDFSVADVLPSPVLRVYPLSWRVKEGDPLLFLCSTEGGAPGKKFHFYKDGVEVTSSGESLLKPSNKPTNPLQNASLRIPHASFNLSGEFACSYEEKRSDQWVMSSWSQMVNITVEPVYIQDSNPIWRYSWMAIPLIILLVLLAFYCWRKKSISTSQEQSELKEKKEERNDLAVMEPQAARAATSSPVKDSEVIYSCTKNFSTPSSLGPTRRNLLTQREEEGILYSDIVFPPQRRQQSHP